VFGDARLGHAWSHLDSAGADALSVDVFETLLWRLVPQPAHAFLLLGERLSAAGRLPPGVTPGQFAHLRVLAEQRARAGVLASRGGRLDGSARVAAGAGYPRLDEVWTLLRPALPDAGELDYLVEAELAVLRAVYRVDLDVVQLVELAAVKLGLPVYLVADTCLSAVQVDRLLARTELAGIPFAGILTSADVGVGPADGLLDHVVAAGPPAARLLHLAGDPTETTAVASDASWDCEPRDGGSKPREGGSRARGPRDDAAPGAGRDRTRPAGWSVTTIRGDTAPVGLRAALAGEGLLADPDDASPIDLEHGDFGLTALRARVLRHGPGTRVPHALRRFWETGATVFGPVFTGFAEWVVERTRELGAEEAFCLMRPGEFLASLLAAPGRAVGVTATPLWASREVCALANVFEASPAELRAFLTHAGTGTSGWALETAGPAGGTVGALLRRLRVDLAAAPGISALAGRRLDMPAGLLDEILDELLDTLSHDDRIRGEIVLAAERLRERFLRYLDQRLPDRGPAVLVDLGWDGATQVQLARLLAATGRDVTPVGLYLATGPAVHAHRLAGHRVEGYLVSGGQPARLAGQLLRAPAIVEQVATSEAGALISFDERATPLLGLGRASRTQLAQRVAVQDGARAFQRAWLRYRDAESPDSLDSVLPSLCGDGARRTLLRTLTRFVARPTAAEAAAFGSWRHDGEDGAVPEPDEAWPRGAADGRLGVQAARDGSPEPAAVVHRAPAAASQTSAGGPSVNGYSVNGYSVNGYSARESSESPPDGQGLLPAELIRRMPYLSPAGLAEIPVREATWPAAVAAVANRPLALVAELAAAAGVDPRELSAPAAAGPVEVYVDTGADFAHGPKVSVVPHAGRDGLSLVRLRVDAVGVRRVRIDPAGRRGLLRLDWLTLNFHLVGAGEPFRVTITAFEGPGSLEMPAAGGNMGSIAAVAGGMPGLAGRGRGVVLGLVGLRKLQPNLVEILDDDPQLVYNLDLPGVPELGGTYAIDVEFAFGWMGIRGDPVAAPAPAAVGPATQLPRRAARRVMRQLGGLR
jgi:hypothetical protein